ncbi:MAG: hypothetical protein ISS18_15210 [Bacteroidales bacterium]|nr:hypothetical protein [Bacteroidales bacterium]
MVGASEYDQFTRQLLNDGNFLVNFVIDNNPHAVFQNLEKLRIQASPDPEVIKKVVFDLLAEGNIETAQIVLDVPVIMKNIPPGYEQAVVNMYN